MSKSLAEVDIAFIWVYYKDENKIEAVFSTYIIPNETPYYECVEFAFIEAKKLGIPRTDITNIIVDR